MKKNLKRIIAAAASASILASSAAPLSTASAAAELFGDINGDGVVDAKDATAILVEYANSIIGKKATIEIRLADTNGDGKITSLDATKVLIFTAEVIIGKTDEAFDEYCDVDFVPDYQGHLLMDDGVIIDYVNIDQMLTSKDNSDAFYYFNYKIQNTSDVDKIVQIWYFDANGTEVDQTCSINIKAGETLEPGKEGSDDPRSCLKKAALTKAGLSLEDVEYFTFSFHVADYKTSDGKFNGTWSRHWDSPKVKLDFDIKTLNKVS